MKVFENDPFINVKQSFDRLYPGYKYEAYLTYEKIENDGDKKAYGATVWPDGEDKAVIFISAELKVMDAVEVLAHELAHVATPGDDHNEEWEKAFEKIHIEHDRICNEHEAAKAADMEHEDRTDDLWYFKRKYNVRRTENEGPCCGNCQRFIFDNTSEVFKFTDIKNHKTEDVRLGTCQLAIKEKSQIVKTIPWDICDAYKIKEGGNG